MARDPRGEEAAGIGTSGRRRHVPLRCRAASVAFAACRCDPAGLAFALPAALVSQAGVRTRWFGEWHERLGLSQRTQGHVPAGEGTRVRSGDEGLPAARPLRLQQSGEERQAETHRPAHGRGVC